MDIYSNKDCTIKVAKTFIKIEVHPAKKGAKRFVITLTDKNMGQAVILYDSLTLSREGEIGNQGKVTINTL